MQLEGLNFAPWRRPSSITELRLCAFVASCQETTLLNQLTKLFITGSLIINRTYAVIFQPLFAWGIEENRAETLTLTGMKK